MIQVKFAGTGLGWAYDTLSLWNALTNQWLEWRLPSECHSLTPMPTHHWLTPDLPYSHTHDSCKRATQESHSVSQREQRRGERRSGAPKPDCRHGHTHSGHRHRLRHGLRHWHYEYREPTLVVCEARDVTTAAMTTTTALNTSNTLSARQALLALHRPSNGVTNASNAHNTNHMSRRWPVLRIPGFLTDICLQSPVHWPIKSPIMPKSKRNQKGDYLLFNKYLTNLLSSLVSLTATTKKTFFEIKEQLVNKVNKQSSRKWTFYKNILLFPLDQRKLRWIRKDFHILGQRHEKFKVKRSSPRVER